MILVGDGNHFGGIIAATDPGDSEKGDNGLETVINLVHRVTETVLKINLSRIKRTCTMVHTRNIKSQKIEPQNDKCVPRTDLRPHHFYSLEVGRPISLLEFSINKG